MPRRVIVADGAPPAALAAVRSLVRAGHRVEVSTSRRWGDRAARSRGVEPFATPSPSHQSAGFGEALLARAKQGGGPVILPCTEAAVLAIEARRAEFERHAQVLLPSSPVLRRVLDKRETLAVARRIGIATPRTVTVTGPADLPAIAGLRYPVVVKPASSRWTARDVVATAGPLYASHVDTAALAATRLLEDGAPGALVQEFVPGSGWGVGLLVRAGSASAVFVHRRLREVHPAGGPSAAAESAPPEPALVEPAIALLRALDWEGLAMVEFRREGLGEPVLMEVNGRTWGTLGLAIDAGVDFPALLVSGGGGLPPAYRAGMRRRWLAGELRRVQAVFYGRPPGYAGPFPSRWRAIADVMLGVAPDFVFRWSDPMPFASEVLDAMS
ncbi:ATP-grasp domain-containing protein [Ramlibacter rhizophilus]|uniref:carboxylate--amine ligase n=1 Tax=Ramlibacter rhizophilus TaxID=1781167 RepID=UPI001F113661|nr:ATP-grasp domain-containing protein [Ramlibacter rhizophilus]